ncbi:hypothetical protein GIB67_032412 [Kingdonia uniflora]|uniref:Uncharacterized protein n=1 Tax=Kingdonia uniflora TaxID=39325 RepID=A0A7J7MJ27_9MAGN|nr:hypothetical protein GIB67_032412 [Kingdonia uniflora]
MLSVRSRFSVNDVGFLCLKLLLQGFDSFEKRCVDVVGSVKGEELMSWDKVPEGVRLEGLTEFCWLCEEPKKLLDPIKLRGLQGVYDLEEETFEVAIRGLRPVEGPLPVKFPLPDPGDPFSLKPGSIASHFFGLKVSKEEKSQSLIAAIAGARAAATQFSKDQKYQNNRVQRNNMVDSTITHQAKKIEDRSSHSVTERRPQERGQNYRDQSNRMRYEGHSSTHIQAPPRSSNQQHQVTRDTFDSTMKHQEDNEDDTISHAFLDRTPQKGVPLRNYEDQNSEMRHEGNRYWHKLTPRGLYQPQRNPRDTFDRAHQDRVSLQNYKEQSSQVSNEGYSRQNYTFRGSNRQSRVPRDRVDSAIKRQAKDEVTTSSSSSDTTHQKGVLSQTYKEQSIKMECEGSGSRPNYSLRGSNTPRDTYVSTIMCQAMYDDTISHQKRVWSQNYEVQQSSQMSSERKPRGAIPLYKAPSEVRK